MGSALERISYAGALSAVCNWSLKLRATQILRSVCGSAVGARRSAMHGQARTCVLSAGSHTTVSCPLLASLSMVRALGGMPGRRPDVCAAPAQSCKWVVTCEAVVVICQSNTDGRVGRPGPPASWPIDLGRSSACTMLPCTIRSDGMLHTTSAFYMPHYLYHIFKNNILLLFLMYIYVTVYSLHPKIIRCFCILIFLYIYIYIVINPNINIKFRS